MAVRTIFSAASWILLAGAILLQFLVILSGAINSNPEKQIYFLQSTTRGIRGAPNPSRWTYFALCGVSSNGRNSDCRGIHPAFPFDPPDRRNFGTEQGVPGQFVGTSKWWYLSRFAWVFFLIALVFSVLALFTGLLALCARLGAYVSALNAAVAAFFQALAASLMTAWVIQGRNAFRSAGQTSSVGVKAMAFTWTSFACLFLSTVLFCLAGSSSGGRSKRGSGYDYGRGAGGGGLFSRNRQSVRSTHSRKSQLSRGSFIDSDRGLGNRGGVKDDYS